MNNNKSNTAMENSSSTLTPLEGNTMNSAYDDSVVNWDEPEVDTKNAFEHESPLVTATIPQDRTKLFVLVDKYAKFIGIHPTQTSKSSNKTKYLCKGTDCPLCIVQERKYTQCAIPVFCIMSGEIEILSFPKFNEPHGLYPQISHLMKTKELPFMIAITRLDNFEYSVATRPLPDETKEEATAMMEKFMRKINAGDLNLAHLYKDIDDTVIESDKIRRGLLAQGYDYKKFLAQHPDPEKLHDFAF
ncbi:MAG: hypothetical protein EOL87_15640 [Spartobacteria bacterium]|nr:hypothetical protein [Spartobacteria bacterium]